MHEHHITQISPEMQDSTTKTISIFNEQVCLCMKKYDFNKKKKKYFDDIAYFCMGKLNVLASRVSLCPHNNKNNCN